MSAGNDIFGNLNDFLENYDDNCLETSKCSEIENDLDNSTRESSRTITKKKTSKTKRMPKTTLKKSAKNETTDQRKVAPSIPEPTPPSAASVPQPPPTPLPIAASVALPPPATLSIAVDLTDRNGVQDEMQELAKMYSFVFYNKDPSVFMHLKNNNMFNSTKRSFTTLSQSLQQKIPTTKSEIAKFKKRIETNHTKLAQLYSLVEQFLAIKSRTSARSTAAARRRSRRLVNSTVDPADVITLDDDSLFRTAPSTSVANGRSRDLIGVNSVIDVDSQSQSDTITLDSDEESSPLESLRQAANNSFESENYEMRIKVKWGNGIETFTHRRHQKFGDLIAKLATKEAADTRCILLNLDDRIIYAEDTPDSIDYKTFQFISGRVLRDNAPIISKTATSSGGNNNIISLKVQLANRKAPLRLQIDKNQTMIVLVIKCAEELKCNPEDIKLYFDGELVDNGSKPEDLELEGDELLDIRFVR